MAVGSSTTGASTLLLHQPTIHHVLVELLDGSLDGGSADTEIPAILSDNLYQAFVAKSQLGTFQTVVVTVQVDELCEFFGRFLKYCCYMYSIARETWFCVRSGQHSTS